MSKHEFFDDLMQRQLDNEKRAVGWGIAEFRKEVAASTKDGWIANTYGGRALIQDAVFPVADKIKAIIDDSLKGGARRHAAAVAHLDAIPAETAAFLAVRTVLNMASQEDIPYGRLAAAVGRLIQSETQHRAMQRESRRTYQYWIAQVKRSNSRITKYRCMKKLRENFKAHPALTSAQQAAVGALLVDAVSEATGWVELYSAVRRGNKRPSLLVTLRKKAMETIEQVHARMEALQPDHDPMLVQPRPWEGVYGGGFIGEVGRRTCLIRAHNRAYLEEVHAQREELAPVLSAVNAIQNTAWHINRRVLDVMEEALKVGGEAFGLPNANGMIYPKRPEEYDRDEQVRLAYVQTLKDIQEVNDSHASQRRAIFRAFDTARRYRDEKAIYFPHSMDWRGRIYPIITYLGPQSSETVRSLLEFAEGLPLGTPGAARWLAIHGANCFGEVDKADFDTRAAWVEENEALILDSADNPLDGERFWAKADEPWQFLAWCFEWAGYKRDGLAHVSHLPVSMDGSCNGLQNFAAMLRHTPTAEAVNLVPSDQPQDIYQRVADRVIETVQRLAASDSRNTEEISQECEARYSAEFKEQERIQQEISEGGYRADDPRRVLLREAEDKVVERRQETRALTHVLAARWIEGQVTRTLVKRPVMTYPYSVTERGMEEQLEEVLREIHRKDRMAWPLRRIRWLTDMLAVAVMEAIQETVRAAADAMRWLQQLAEVWVEECPDLPVMWTSPIGFPVQQSYRVMSERRVSTHAGGIKYTPVMLEPTAKLDKRKQRSGIAPNFVHSCDASHLMATVNACVSAGITSFHMIHDSYGTHACNADRLASTLREEFVRMYSRDVLGELRDTALRYGIPENALPMPPAKGDFDLTRVRDSAYFFA